MVKVNTVCSSAVILFDSTPAMVIHTRVTSQATKSKIGVYVLAELLCLSLAVCF